MLNDTAAFLREIYGTFLSDPKTQLVFGFVTLFIAAAVVFGFNRAALSRKAITNTLTTLAILALNLLLAPVVYVLSDRMVAHYDRLALPAIDPSFWENWPWLAVAIIGLVGKDFSDYWCHRLLHTKIGWPVHAVHHSDSHVNGFTTFRVHVLELVLMKAMYITLLTWLGIPPTMIAGAYVFASLHNAYVHFEADIDHGPFNWLIASPRFHRWHHADLPEAYGKNLANMIPAWDMLFGTYYRAGPCHERMGAEAEGIPATDPARLLLLPFTLWARQLRMLLGDALARLRPGAG